MAKSNKAENIRQHREAWNQKQQEKAARIEERLKRDASLTPQQKLDMLVKTGARKQRAKYIKQIGDKKDG